MLASPTWLKSLLLPVRRFREGKPLSLLDGVPYSVIDGLDALPYCTTAGTTFVRALASFCSFMQPCTKPGKCVTCVACFNPSYGLQCAPGGLCGHVYLLALTSCMLRLIRMCDTPDDAMQCTCVRHPHDCSATFTSQPVAQLAEERLVAGDAPSIAALRASGAMLIGKNTLHEIGVGMTGLNTRMGTARNPHDPSRYTGGSSSGSAAAVACGLVAFSLGGQPAQPYSRIHRLAGS